MTFSRVPISVCESLAGHPDMDLERCSANPDAICSPFTHKRILCEISCVGTLLFRHHTVGGNIACVGQLFCAHRKKDQNGDMMIKGPKWGGLIIA